MDINDLQKMIDQALLKPEVSNNINRFRIGKK